MNLTPLREVVRYVSEGKGGVRWGRAGGNLLNFFHFDRILSSLTREYFAATGARLCIDGRA